MEAIVEFITSMPTGRFISAVIVLLLLAGLGLALHIFAKRKSKPSDADLYAIGSKIRYPKNESYLSDYKYGSINSPWGSDVSVYSFYYAEPMKNNKRNIDLPHGTAVKVLAEENGFACVIVNGLAQACWVNAKYIDYR